MNKTKIEWCDSTWNPVTGCLHDCEYCYARKIAKRFGRPDTNGILDPHSGGKLHEIDMPIISKETGRIIPYPYEFSPTLHKCRLDELQHMKKSQNIFVCSMADLFGKWIPDKWIEAVFEACEKAPQHRYLFLTKNPERYVNLYEAGKLPDKANMWYGTTITNTDMPFLHSRVCTAFLSIEPLMSEFSNIRCLGFLGIKWVIIGAETGNRKDKVIPQKEWIDNICEAAAITQIPVFMKDSLVPIVGEENMRRELPWKS